jgi:hypothetical protein
VMIAIFLASSPNGDDRSIFGLDSLPIADNLFFSGCAVVCKGTNGSIASAAESAHYFKASCIALITSSKLSFSAQ